MELRLFFYRFEVLHLNSIERKEKRFLRRKNKRIKKNISRSNLYANIDITFCFHKVMFYADLCCKGVAFKRSTQNFKLHLFTTIATTCRNIKDNKYKVGKTYSLVINERGKIRHIEAPLIKERLIHKVLTNEILLPIYYPHFAYDNGACIKNKGYKFAMDRVAKKLSNWYCKYKLNGYVVLLDFSNFFPAASHLTIHHIHKKYLLYDYIIKIIEDYLFVCKNGIPLGVEIAQIEACMLPNKLDHYLQSQGVPFERYMDDTFFLVKSKVEAEKICLEYEKIANKLNIAINKKKTKIVPLSNNFIYCKWKYIITENGKIIRIPAKKTIYRQRRKLKRMVKLF